MAGWSGHRHDPRHDLPAGDADAQVDVGRRQVALPVVRSPDPIHPEAGAMWRPLRVCRPGARGWCSSWRGPVLLHPSFRDFGGWKMAKVTLLSCMLLAIVASMASAAGLNLHWNNC